MTTAELDSVIDRFRAGGRVEHTNPHAGERMVWWYEAEADRFIARTQGAWSADRTDHYTEDALRALLAPLPFTDWSGRDEVAEA
ncbi:MAG: hypothetical protein ACI8RZ_000994 [Myxococcota bacterium]|jgi:hypothetical protein